MKKYLFIALLCAFTLNGFGLSAEAAPCPMKKDTMTMQKDMPCHGDKTENQKSVDMPCCKGVCLCKHASLFPALALPGDIKISFLKPAASVGITPQTAFISLIWGPPRRPPKFLS